MAKFASALAAYFMDFLETNLHKRRLPKRSIKFRDKDGLLVGISGHKYKRFSQDVWNVITRGISSNSKVVIRQEQHQTQVPMTLLKLIKGFCETAVTEDRILALTAECETQIRQAHTSSPTNIEEARSRSLELCSGVFETQVIKPLLDLVSEPLQTHSPAGSEMSGTICEDLSGLLVSPLEPHIDSIIQRLELKQEVNITDELNAAISVEIVSGDINRFFEELALSDMYYEVRELFDNKFLKDKHEFYIYLGEIRYDGTSYPIFYLPVKVSQTKQTFQVSFDSTCYVNRKAIDFIVQETNKNTGKRGHISTARQRILYPNEYKERFVSRLDKTIRETSEYFHMNPTLTLSDPHPQGSRGELVSMNNTCHLCIFDKSDEALVNDYEELLAAVKAGDDTLLTKFRELIENFIKKDPTQYIKEVNERWEETDIAERLVYECPVPLNGEQRKILLALRNKNCKYIAVEGPPGTGKSHTIAALVFDEILHGRSVLILSDKKEALDVAENMIIRVLNKVRHTENFQNPVLRLGKAGNTYAKILSNTSLENIRNHYTATKSKYSTILKSIADRKKNIQDLIRKEYTTYEKVSLKDLNAYHRLEKKWLEDNTCPVNLDEVITSDNGLEDIGKFRASCRDTTKALQVEVAGTQVKDLYPPTPGDDGSIGDLKRFIKMVEITKSISKSDYDKVDSLKLLKSWSENDFKRLNRILIDFGELRLPIVGYLFRGKQIAALETTLNASFDWLRHVQLRRDAEALSNIQTISFNMMQQYQRAIQARSPLPKGDILSSLHAFLTRDTAGLSELHVEEILLMLKRMRAFHRSYPTTASQLRLVADQLNSYLNCTIATLKEDEWESLQQFLELRKTLPATFASLPQYEFKELNGKLQEETTHKMAHTFDGQVIDFHDNYKATAKTIRECVRKKLRFPKDKFLKVKEAFPCIISSVRDYAEYIPIESDIFDLVIIDEASQVSIAQAFPALLRGKKVVVFGDRKQFSNVKAALARTDLNRDYLTRLEVVFKENISNDPSELLRLKKFDIKTSVLELFEFISNFTIMLRKHFRGYREHISYSSKYFYEGHLQAIKIRVKPIAEILTFTILKHDGLLDPIANTNSVEAQHIAEQLLSLKDRGEQLSVGIITPHTNQQKYISKLLSSHPAREYFYDKLNLKVMTFDTCQGEERDIIYYSMVAHPGMDRLWGVFPKSLDNLDLEEQGNLRAQRLNVGFSRVKEKMNFVLSKPPESYDGAIGEALLHYKEVLNRVQPLPSQSDVDPRSPMEGKVLEWIQNTPFFQEFSNNIELRAQFPIGEYLKQLDPTYQHPRYRTDFLFIFKDQDGTHDAIIIEYDGFKEHFENYGEIDATNFDQYYTRDHVEREKILEAYGFKFMRLNRFNAGKNPVETIDKGLRELLKKTVKIINQR